MTMELIVAASGMMVAVQGIYNDDWAQACFGLLMIVCLHLSGIAHFLDALPSPTQEAPPMTALAEKQSHTWTRSEYEWYVDPPSCAAALFDVEQFDGVIHDPCCGMGNIVRAARSMGYNASGTDISGRFAQYHKIDFFGLSGRCDNIAFNPPYGKHPDKGLRLEERAIVHARDLARRKVCALLHLKWMACRLPWLKEQGCVRIWAISPRPSMLPGANIQAGEIPGGGMQDYAWYVFEGDGPSDAIQIGSVERDKTLDLPENWTWRLEQSQ